VPNVRAAILRQGLRPIALIAVGLLVLQTFLAGLATAQAATSPLQDAFGAGAICHGAGGAEPAAAPEGAPPDGSQAWNLCCAVCVAASGAVLPVGAPALQRFEFVRNARAAIVPGPVPVARRAVRAGSSQAPPGRA
jgi:hypothetical protein